MQASQCIKQRESVNSVKACTTCVCRESERADRSARVSRKCASESVRVRGWEVAFLRVRWESERRGFSPVMKWNHQTPSAL